MKKTISLIFILLLVAVLSACNDEQPELNNTDNNLRENYREHQVLTELDTLFDADSMMRITISEVGLENVFIKEASNMEMLEENTYCQVYLLADDRYGGNRGTSDHYLAITNGDKIIVQDLSEWEDQACYSGNIELCDFDGDGDKEILLQETIGMSGGAGQYLSRVFDFENGTVVEIFSSVCGTEEEFNTGFYITVLENNKFLMQNTFTEYIEEFSFDDIDGEDYYRNYCYDENGTPQPLSILVDSFYEFLPDDIDGDGIDEITCRQYVSLIGHSNGIGNARTVLKYNKEVSAFEVVSSNFELNRY